MRLTDYLAIWGAVLSSLVAAWNIYKDVIKRERVTVSAGFRIMFSDATDKQDVFVVTATNHGDKVISVTHVGVHSAWQNRWRRIGRLLHRPLAESHLLSFSPLNSPLPRKVEPRHHEMIIYTITREQFPPVKHLYVATADGKVWYAPRRDVLAIRSEIEESRATA